MKRHALVTAALALSLAAGCGAGASRPPSQLADARAAYEDAARDPSAGLVHEDLAGAKATLAAAERSFKDSGDSAETKSLAYVAQRRAVAVKAKAETLKAIDDKKAAIAEYERAAHERAVASRERLDRAEGERALAEQREAAMQKARARAEQDVDDALCQIPGVEARAGERGLVLTLSGASLFAAGKSRLLLEGKQRLAEVATALHGDDRTLLVAGYTDARGSDAVNERLSVERADAVRDYLVSLGVDEARIRAEGFGKAEPIADDATAEGRAKNRRVEIVLESAPGSGETPAMREQREGIETRKGKAAPPKQQRLAPRRAPARR